MTSPGPVSSLSLGFREAILSHDEITRQVHAWAEAFPTLVRVTSIGTSEQGRDLWLLTIGPDPDRARPSAWVDGNMHAQEVSGSSAALAIAEDVLRLHVEPDFAPGGLPAHLLARLREVRFFVMPRMCPDGAEAVNTTGRYVRSNPRDRRPLPPQGRWVMRDMDGDGLAFLMRRQDATGDFVESREIPGVMCPREIEDAGPYYRIYPEGEIDGFDGSTVPDAGYLSDNDVDLNRNFPWSWAPEHEQIGAGQYPLSEPESRAVVEFASAHPEIYTWLNLHTFGGVYIRPSGHFPDSKMEPHDLAIYHQVGHWGETIGGYPMVSGFHEFLYEPDRPLHGDLGDFAYFQRGCLAFVCEIWDLFRQVGLPVRKPFVDHYSHLSRQDIEAVARWDREKNEGRAFLPWREFDHPQLGRVELGGIDPRIGLVNPSRERLPEVCERQSAFYLRVASLVPSVQLSSVVVVPLGPGLSRVDVTLENLGYLPTCGMAVARVMPWNHPIVATAHPLGCTLADPSTAQRTVGHMGGWGNGLHRGWSSPSMQRSDGSVASRKLSWVVRGHGELVIKVSSPRLGTVETRVSLPGESP